MGRSKSSRGLGHSINNFGEEISLWGSVMVERVCVNSCEIPMKNQFV